MSFDRFIKMPEKRSHPPNGNEQTPNKKPRSTNGSPAATAITGARQVPTNIQEQIAAAKARAAAARDRITGAKPSSPAPGSVPPAPQQPSTGATPAGAARAKVEAMRARVAAATAKSGPTASSAAPPSGSAFQSTETDDGLSRARGGLGIGLHPALMGDAGQDSRGKKTLGPKFGTTMGNKRHDPAADQQGTARRQLDLSAPPVEELKENPYYDSSLGSASAVPQDRKSRELIFNQKGKYIAQAASLRRQAQFEAMKAKIAASARKAGLDEDRSEQAFVVKDVPEVEWWDEGLVSGGAYPDFDGDFSAAQQKVKIDTDDSIITCYVQHPVLLEPPQERLPFEQKPMHLTKEEQKKMRRQTRMADLKEKQAKVRLGLEPPEPPKIKKSNLMRVLGEQAVKDPTAVEARVTREIAERREKHEVDNETRKLTKEQRHEKLAGKMEKDAEKGLSFSVYRVDSLAYNKNRNKIDMNAKQFHDLTGLMLTSPKVNVIILEAGQHTTNYFKKLMLRRIQWTENAPATAILDESGPGKDKDKAPFPSWLKPEDDNGKLKNLKDNRCVLIWEGEIKERSFKRWGERDCETDGQARQALEKSKMENMWMLAKNWSG